MSVFGKNNGRSNRVKRNVFDLSFQNNLTTKFGQLTPCFCKEVLPGDSFKIDTTFGLRFMPTYFPLQTRIRADIHFFYVRNRNLWRDWMDFIGDSKANLVPPYRTSFVETGSLGDYLGIPTVKKGYSYSSWTYDTDYLIPYDVSVYGQDVKINSCHQLSHYFTFPNSTTGCHMYFSVGGSIKSLDPTNSPAAPQLGLPAGTIVNTSGKDGSFIMPFNGSPATLTDTPFLLTVPFLLSVFNEDLSCVIRRDPIYELVVFNPASQKILRKISSTSISTWQNTSVLDFGPISYSLSEGESLALVVGFKGSFAVAEPFYEAPTWKPYVRIAIGTKINSPASDSDYESLALSALPFRAYESIYNSFYRDDRNNPRLVNGEPVYNEYVRSKDGGRDLLDYPLYFRNWEQDFLTTAVPTPQQGNAPLVGISSTGTMTFEHDGRQYTADAQTADDNDTIISASFTENVPGAVARSLVDVVSSGISINDFRNVNAFQRWKETNLRRGMKYKDQIKSHFDVNVSYAELDMPEFIGGVSIPVTPTTVTATSESGDVTLGDYRGQLYGTGSSKHSVSQYFDEHGFVIGILSVVPVPVYSQLLPKFFLKKSPLDYFFPEFGHIGFQPISNNEVNMLSVENKNDPGIFGYQRPWYDYIGAVDEAHGQFRTTLTDFLLSRTFDGVPNLGQDFTVIKPDDLNHVFTETSNNDKILGQIYFKVTAKRPIPLYGVPRLESDL